MRQYIFVGERPSKTAVKNNWSWTDGRLAAKQLFDALENACGIDPAKQRYCNLWPAKETPWWQPDMQVVSQLRIEASLKKWTIVGMGRKVQDELDILGIDHLRLVHPAARGLIRRKHIYGEHVATVLLHSRRVNGIWRQL